MSTCLSNDNYAVLATIFPLSRHLVFLCPVYTAHVCPVVKPDIRSCGHLQIYPPNARCHTHATKVPINAIRAIVHCPIFKDALYTITVLPFQPPTTKSHHLRHRKRKMEQLNRKDFQLWIEYVPIFFSFLFI